MGLECRILPTSTRNLRQTKAEMRRELEELKWNMRQGGSDPTHMHATPTSNVGSGDGQMHSPLEHGSAYSIAERTEGSRSMSPSHSGSAPPTQNGSHPHPTLPRILDGFVVDSKKIEDCFNMYMLLLVREMPVTDGLTDSLPSIMHSSQFWMQLSLLMNITRFLHFFSGASLSQDREDILKTPRSSTRLAS